MSYSIWIYSLVSVFIVSLVSLIGIFTLGLNEKILKKSLLLVISFSAGALFGDAFLHLLPEIVLKKGFSVVVSLSFLAGIVIFFVLEKGINWQHCHGHMFEKNHVHTFGYTNLIGGGLHNFIDGMIIGASYLVSLPAGIATTIAVLLHEIPQEIGDFGILIHAGFSKFKAILLNLGTAFTSIIGVVIALFLENKLSGFEEILIPIAAGGFVYIAGSDLIPELHKHSQKLSDGILQLISFLIGIGVMWALLFI